MAADNAGTELDGDAAKTTAAVDDTAAVSDGVGLDDTATASAKVSAKAADTVEDAVKTVASSLQSAGVTGGDVPSAVTAKLADCDAGMALEVRGMPAPAPLVRAQSA